MQIGARNLIYKRTAPKIDRKEICLTDFLLLVLIKYQIAWPNLDSEWPAVKKNNW